MQSNRKELASDVRVVVEVDGNPVGVLNLDIDRLWPLINHSSRDEVPVEWMDAEKFQTMKRASVIKRLMSRLQNHLYQTLGNEIVKAQLDVESFSLRVENAAQVFGRKRSDIEKLVAESDRTMMDFYGFLWDYLLDDREVIDLKKEWKAAGTAPR